MNKEVFFLVEKTKESIEGCFVEIRMIDSSFNSWVLREKVRGGIFRFVLLFLRFVRGFRGDECRLRFVQGSCMLEEVLLEEVLLEVEWK